MLKKKLALVIIFIISLANGGWANAQRQSGTILQDKSKTVRVKFLSPDGKPVTNITISLHSDNGLRCVTTPCPTNSKDWNGKSNAQGIVNIPKSFLQKSTTVWTKTYPNGTDLIAQAKKGANGVWTVKLR
jgi:hypothetical protein